MIIEFLLTAGERAAEYVNEGRRLFAADGMFTRALDAAPTACSDRLTLTQCVIKLTQCVKPL